MQKEAEIVTISTNVETKILAVKMQFVTIYRADIFVNVLPEHQVILTLADALKLIN